MEPEPNPIKVELERRAAQARQIEVFAAQLKTLPSGPQRSIVEAELARLEQVVSARKGREFAAGMAKARPRL